ncbi:MAG: hypothetical protein OXC60_16070 [Litoreibacter sp.]|nr:hypothetical protein [Litoreibacter sp.]
MKPVIKVFVVLGILLLLPLKDCERSDIESGAGQGSENQKWPIQKMIQKITVMALTKQMTAMI